jgi:hypothetical protein
VSGGRFGCGYVVTVNRTQRKVFVAGLTDWFGEKLPTAMDLAGHRVIEHAKAHLKTITEHGPEILGCCDAPLEVRPDPRDHAWGFNVIRVLAEKYAKAR